MKRVTSTLITALLVVLLALPVAAFANRGGGGLGTHAQKLASRSAKKQFARKEAAKDRQKKDTGRHRAKASDKSTKGPKGHGSTKASTAVGRDKTSKSPEASSEGSATRSEMTSLTARQGSSNAFLHITANLEKSLAKIATGRKKQLPPGLVSVWLKLASWLGVDPAQIPGSSTTPPGGSTDAS